MNQTFATVSSVAGWSVRAKDTGGANVGDRHDGARPVPAEGQSTPARFTFAVPATIVLRTTLRWVASSEQQRCLHASLTLCSEAAETIRAVPAIGAATAVLVESE